MNEPCRALGCGNRAQKNLRGLCKRHYLDPKARAEFARPKRGHEPRAPHAPRAKPELAAAGPLPGREIGAAERVAEAIWALVDARIEARTEFLEALALRLREIAIRARHELRKKTENDRAAENVIAATAPG